MICNCRGVGQKVVGGGKAEGCRWRCTRRGGRRTDNQSTETKIGEIGR